MIFYSFESGTIDECQNFVTDLNINPLCLILTLSAVDFLDLKVSIHYKRIQHYFIKRLLLIIFFIIQYQLLSETFMQQNTINKRKNSHVVCGQGAIPSKLFPGLSCK